MQLPVRLDVVSGFTGIRDVCEGSGLLLRLRELLFVWVALRHGALRGRKRDITERVSQREPQGREI
jgi:hypothetical protein